jgi:hypothetical protein
VKTSGIEKLAQALYEAIPVRIYETYGELDANAKTIWRDIALRHFANGGDIPAPQPRATQP